MQKDGSKAIGKRQPFARVRLDEFGKVVACDGSGEEFALMRPFLTLGSNLFEQADACPGMRACHQNFLRGVKHGFLNSVLDCTFIRLARPMLVKTHMMTVPDADGKRHIVLFFTLIDWVESTDAFKDTQANSRDDDFLETTTPPQIEVMALDAPAGQTVRQPTDALQSGNAVAPPAAALAYGTPDSMNALVGAVLAKLQVAPAGNRSPAHALADVVASGLNSPQNKQAAPPRHQDILQF